MRARTVTTEMSIAAARQLAEYAEARGIHDNNILPRMDEWEVFPQVAVATAMQAQEQGVARLSRDEELLYGEAKQRIGSSREATAMLMCEGIFRATARP